MKYISLSILALAQLALACPGHVNYARQSDGPPYDYDQAGADWTSIGYPECTGKEQSPIDIPSKIGLSQVRKPVFGNYNNALPGLFGNWGYGPNFTLNDLPASGRVPTLSFDGETTFLAQWHTHAPAEHLIDGQRAAAEIHLVHTKADGTARAVLAFLVEQGAKPSEFFSQFPSPLPPPTPDNDRIPTSLEHGSLLRSVGNFKNFYTYRGSLTTPPCSEGLRWYVAADRVQISKEQMQALLDVSRFSAREVQPIIDQDINQ